MSNRRLIKVGNEIYGYRNGASTFPYIVRRRFGVWLVYVCSDPDADTYVWDKRFGWSIFNPTLLVERILEHLDNYTQ